MLGPVALAGSPTARGLAAAAARAAEAPAARSSSPSGGMRATPASSSRRAAPAGAAGAHARTAAAALALAPLLAPRRGRRRRPGRCALRALAELSRAELAEALRGERRANALWGALRDGRPPPEDSLAALPDAEALRAALRPEAVEEVVRAGGAGSAPPGVDGAVQAELGRGCTTAKFLLRLHDGHAVEAVLIPKAASRGKHKSSTTLCVSSQVGCAQGCRFCATASMGIVRNLSADEILAQVAQGSRLASVFGFPRLTNLVFMGMGEPSKNPRAVLAAAEVLTDTYRMAFSRHKLTVSTVGPSPEAVRGLSGLRGNLAWSLHTADDQLRRSLVPSARHSVAELRDALAATLRGGDAKRLGRRLLIQIALIDGINDSLEHATRVAELLRPLYEDEAITVALDIIPYNDTGRPGFRRPPMDVVTSYRDAIFDILPRALIQVRHTRGDDAAAACGQLNTTRMRQQVEAEAGGLEAVAAM